MTLMPSDFWLAALSLSVRSSFGEKQLILPLVSVLLTPFDLEGLTDVTRTTAKPAKLLPHSWHPRGRPDRRGFPKPTLRTDEIRGKHQQRGRRGERTGSRLTPAWLLTGPVNPELTSSCQMDSRPTGGPHVWKPALTRTRTKNIFIEMIWIK